MWDHVENIHLRGVPAEQRIICYHPIYKAKGLPLEGGQDFKNHDSPRGRPPTPTQSFLLLILSSCDFPLEYILLGVIKILIQLKLYLWHLVWLGIRIT
jgi:hypothetical protein